MSFTFTGSRITCYGRMGLGPLVEHPALGAGVTPEVPDTGVAAVYIDGKLDRVVMTYTGAEMANIALYSRVFSATEQHTIKIVAAKPGEL